MAARGTPPLPPRRRLRTVATLPPGPPPHPLLITGTHPLMGTLQRQEEVS